MGKIKLTWLGDSCAVNTGFGMVSSNILERLYVTGKYDISMLALNHDYAEPHVYEGMIKIFPASAKGDIFGYNRLVEVVLKTSPDIIMFNNDVWVIAKYLLQLQNADEDIKKHFHHKIMTYTPVDAGPMQSTWLDIFEKNKVAKVIAYTEFGKNILKQANGNLDYEIVGHGVDTDKFYPVSDARGFFENIPDGFIVQNVGRNQPRKRLDLWIKLMAKWLGNLDYNERKQVYFFYHGKMKDMGYDLEDLAGRYDIKGNFLHNDQANITPAKGVSTDVLNKTYNLADVHINVSCGEGWGLPQMESAACRVPQIIPAHSAMKEVWQDVGLLIDIDHYDTLSAGVNTEGAVINIDSAIQHLDTMFRNPEKRKQLGELAYNHVKQEKYSWDFVVKQFDKLITEVLNDH